MILSMRLQHHWGAWLTGEMVQPQEPQFSGFVFKIQANYGSASQRPNCFFAGMLWAISESNEDAPCAHKKRY